MVHLPRRRRTGLDPGPVCFQQLTRMVMDFDFLHGVMLLSFCARA